MKLRLTRNVTLPTGPFNSGSVVCVDSDIGARLLAYGFAVPADTIEQREPEPENRDPAPAKRRKK